MDIAASITGVALRFTCMHAVAPRFSRVSFSQPLRVRSISRRAECRQWRLADEFRRRQGDARRREHLMHEGFPPHDVAM